MPPYKLIIEVIVVVILLALLIIQLVYDFKILRNLSDEVNEVEASLGQSQAQPK